jgi:hypothetical protein
MAELNEVKFLLVVIVVLVSFIVGMAAGLLARAEKRSTPAAVLAGGSGFGASIMVGLAILTACGYV